MMNRFSRSFAQDTGLCDVSHVDKDIVSRVTVEGSTEIFLVKVVADKADAASENEQAVQSADLHLVSKSDRLLKARSVTNFDIFIGFIRGEGTAIT